MMVFSESPLLLKFYEQCMQLDINLMRHWPRLTGQMKKELDFLRCVALLQYGQAHTLFKLSMPFEICKAQK